MVANRCNGKDKVGSSNSQVLFSISSLLGSEWCDRKNELRYDRPGTESSLTAKALDISLIKLSYLIYKMGMIMPP